MCNFLACLRSLHCEFRTRNVEQHPACGTFSQQFWSVDMALAEEKTKAIPSFSNVGFSTHMYVSNITSLLAFTYLFFYSCANFHVNTTISTQAIFWYVFVSRCTIVEGKKFQLLWNFLDLLFPMNSVSRIL